MYCKKSYLCGATIIINMKNRFTTLVLICFLACLPTAVFAGTPIADGVYYITCTKLDGFLGLGAYHDVDPHIYYVATGEEKTDDAYWVITNTQSGYTFRNEASGEWLVFTTERVDQYYKYMKIVDEPVGDGSEYWNIIEGSDGAYSVQSVVNGNYYWNLRSGTNMLGTYSGSSGTSDNERFLFHEKDDNPGPGPDPQVEHEYVDLGLPSGTLWATCNVGANSPEGYGDYFAWGETKPKKSNGTWGDYSWGTYAWMNPGQADWTQINKYTFADNQTEACWYNSNGTFIGDGNTVLLPEDDAATANWGSEWQTPSLAQFEELIDSENTTSTWTTKNGVNGRLVTSKKNSASIFLPAAGRLNGTESQWKGSYGFYWPNVADRTYSDRACQINFDASSVSAVGSFDRYAGESIRPVRVEKKTEGQFPSDQYTSFTFPQALHVYLADGRCEAYPLKFVSSQSEANGQLVIQTNLGQTFTYALSEVDSVSTRRPDFPTFDTFKFGKKTNDQLFGAVNGEVVADTVFASIAAIGKRLTPTFGLSDEAAMVYANGKLQGGDGDRLRFDKDIYYLVSKSGYTILTPEEGGNYSQRPYGRCVRVHVDWLTDRAEVPTIYIDTEDGQPITSKDYYKNATIRIDGHDIFPSMAETPVQIKGRGNSSWSWPKKPYRLKFAEKMKPLGMTKGKSWVLLSNYQTGSLMSNAIGMKAANLMGASGANHIVPVDLYLNGEYRGSYNFTEKVGFSNNSVDIPDETMAAMLELDSYYDEPAGQKFRTSPYYNLPINVKEPDFSEATTQLTLETVQSSFNSFISTLYNGMDISRFVDIEQLCRFMMVNELTLNYEFYHPKSTFCYRENFDDEESKYIFGPVWDLDWCFGYERNRNYFRSESTANYWKDMTSMEATEFVRDLRWKYKPLNDVYTQLWEQFMENDLQELLEYCQDYYDFAKNSFNDNKSRWGDNTNYAQQATQASNWLSARAEKIYQDIINGVRPDIIEPAEPVEFANNKLYTISCKRGDLILSYDYKGLEAGQSAWWTVYDYEKQFAIINIEGTYYLYNPYLKKYLRTGYSERGEWIEALGSPIFFDTYHPDGEYLYMISTLTETGNTCWLNNNSTTIVINNYSTPDDGDRWKITEVGEFDPTEALALASTSLYAVTNRYIFNGEVIGEESRQLPKGSALPAPSGEWSNAFVKLTQPANMPSSVQEDVTLDYQVEWYGPFEFTTSPDEAYWYNMTIRTNYYVSMQDSEPYYPGDASEDDLLHPQFNWAFGGNPYHVVVYNLSTGFDKSLSPDGEYAVMRPGEYAWDLLPNMDGFVLRKAGTGSSCVNQFGGSSGPLKFWHDSGSVRDDGSTFRIFESLVDGVGSPMAASKGGDAIYNVAGQRLDKLQKGVNIVGGKKVLVK
jgi:hypothetical protein